MLAAQISKAVLGAKATKVRTLVVLSLAAILTGCSSASELDVFGIFEEDPPMSSAPGQASLRERGDAASQASRGQQPPALSSVPARPDTATPPDVRQRVVEGLVADRANARYSDQAVRLQDGSRASERAPATTTAPPPPQVSSVPTGQRTQVGSRAGGNAAGPTQIAPPPPLPVPLPVDTGPRPSVQVDATAINGGSDFPLRARLVTIDEQVATIHFGHSSSKLDDRDKSVIAQVASAQRQNGAEIVVVGHASGRTQQLDKVEHELANFRISLARANRVAEQLIAMGVAREKVLVEAFADGSPVYSETMPTGEAGNRRAEIYFRQ